MKSLRECRDERVTCRSSVFNVFVEYSGSYSYADDRCSQDITWFDFGGLHAQDPAMHNPWSALSSISP